MSAGVRAALRNRRHQDPRKLQEVYANTRQRQTLQANTRQRQALQYMRPELRNRRHQESSKRCRSHVSEKMS